VLLEHRQWPDSSPQPPAMISAGNSHRRDSGMDAGGPQRTITQTPRLLTALWRRAREDLRISAFEVQKFI